MTATVQRPKSILLPHGDASHRMSLCSLVGRSKSSCGISIKQAPVSAGKLKNLRNYYSTRRPSLQAPTSRIVVSPERQSRVRFRAGVSVHEIPSRNDYTKEDKKAIWMPRKELKKLILKNHAESSYEGRDWRNALEEDDFVIGDNGQPIHPAHVRKNVVALVAPPQRPTKKPTQNQLCRRRLPLARVNKSPRISAN